MLNFISYVVAAPHLCVYVCLLVNDRFLKFDIKVSEPFKSVESLVAVCILMKEM